MERSAQPFSIEQSCGKCTRGSSCKFAHHKDELQTPPNLSRTLLCKTFMRTGTCEEPTCRYAHSKEELRAAPVRVPLYGTRAPVGKNINVVAQELPWGQGTARWMESLQPVTQQQRYLAHSPPPCGGPWLCQCHHRPHSKNTHGELLALQRLLLRTTAHSCLPHQRACRMRLHLSMSGRKITPSTRLFRITRTGT